MSTERNNISPLFEQNLKERFQTPQPGEAFARALETRLLNRQAELNQIPAALPATGRGWLRRLLARPALAIVTALLALVLLSGSAYALGRLTGFLPGVGFVEEVQGMLKAPVVVTEALEQTQADAAAEQGNGVSVSVKQAVAAGDTLIVEFSVDGLAPDFLKGKTAPDFLENGKAQVRLPDGAWLEPIATGRCGGSTDAAGAHLSCRNEWRLPAGSGVNFVLVLPAYSASSMSVPQEKMEIALQLERVEGTLAGVDKPQDARSENRSDLSLRLTRAAQTPQQTAFQFEIKHNGEQVGTILPGSIRMQDEQGRYYLTDRAPDLMTPIWDYQTQTVQSAMVTYPLQSKGPFTFTLDYVNFIIDDPVTLRVNIPADAKPGTSWEMDETVSTGGISLRVVRGEISAGGETGYALDLYMEADSSLEMLGIRVAEDIGSSSHESRAQTASGLFFSRLALPEGTTGELDLEIFDVWKRVDGPWSVQWTPEDPALIGALAPTQAPDHIENLDIPPAGNPLFAELDTRLKENFPASAYAEGWTRQLTEYENKENSLSGFTPGWPAVMTVETWREIDSRGYVTAEQTIRKDASGRMVGMGWTRGGWSFNLPEVYSSQGNEVYLTQPDYGARGMLRAIQITGGKITYAEQESDGGVVDVYTLTYGSGEPGMRDPYQAEYVFEQGSGTLLSLESWSLNLDGSRELLNRTRYLSVESVAGPSPEVQGYFDMVVLPR